MAAVGAEVGGSFFLSSGVVSFFILLILLSIFLTALCSVCRRQSFELQNPEGSRNPSSLVRVMKLEEAVEGRENPMAYEIQRDEKDVRSNGGAGVTREIKSETEEEISISYIRWRSHLGASQSQDVNSGRPPDSDLIYHTIDDRRSSGGDADMSPPTANHEPEREQRSDSAPVGFLSRGDMNSVYAQVSKRVRPPPADTVEEVQVVEEEEEEEESLPPLPDRMTQLEE